VPPKKRNYGREYERYHSKPAQKKDRASRNAARRAMVKSGAAKKGDGKDVDHKNRKPRDNNASNLRMTSQKQNRGWRKGA
jgi:hypothetical protein